MKTKKFYLLLVTILITSVMVKSQDKQEPKGLAVGDTVQNFQAIDADSTLYVFNEMIKKEAIVLIFIRGQ